MAQVRAIRLCQVDNTLRQEGAVFEYNGPYNGNLEYLDGQPPEAQAAAPVAAEAPAEPAAEASAKKWKPKAKRTADADEGSV